MRIVNQVRTSYTAWAKRQLDRALQAPVIPSQGERWIAGFRSI